MLVSVSVLDFPLFKTHEYILSGLKEAGVDSIELVTGIKSRFRLQKLLKLSERLSLPITSLHQPPWSIFPGLFDEGFIREGTQIGVKKFVFHPLPRYSFKDRIMKEYLQKLERMQEKYDITVMLENMPIEIRPALFKKFLPLASDTTNIMDVLYAIKTHRLKMTLDISHAYVSHPVKEPWFDHMFPYLANIHLSSFTKSRDHLPVYMGDFDTKAFIPELKKRGYKGLLNLEIFYPSAITFMKYDLEPIQKSVEFIKSID